MCVFNEYVEKIFTRKYLNIKIYFSAFLQQINFSIKL